MRLASVHITYYMTVTSSTSLPPASHCNFLILISWQMYMSWIIQTASSKKVPIPLAASLVAIKSETRVDTFGIVKKMMHCQPKTHKLWVPNKCGSSARNLLHVTFLTHRILRRLLDFWKICESLLYNVIT